MGFPSWRTGPPLFPSCLARIGALDREAQPPFCDASSDAWRKRDVKSSLVSRLPRPVLQALLVVLEKVFALRRKKAVYPFPYNRRTHTISLPAQIERELRRLVSTGKKVEAMKSVISLTGAGLRVSKDYVDTLDLLYAPLRIPLVRCHINSFRRASRCGEAMARRRKYDGQTGIVSRGS